MFRFHSYTAAEFALMLAVMGAGITGFVVTFVR
jgi:hypothetical protein